MVYILYFNYKNFINNIKLKFNIIYFIAFSYLILLTFLKFSKYINNNYDYFDFGFYLHKIFNCGINNIDFECNSGHFQPIIFLFKIFTFFDFFPFILLLTSTLIITVSGILISHIALILFKDSTLAVIIGLCFFLFPMTSFIDLLGFHPDIFAILFCTLSFFFLSKNYIYLSFLAFSFVIFCGEQWLFSFILFSLYLYYFSKKKLFLFLFFLSVLVSFLIFLYLSIISSEHNIASVLSDDGPYSSLINFNLNRVLFENFFKKLYFLFFLFFPFLLFHEYIILIIIPDLAKILLSTELLHFMVDSHYTVIILPVIFYSYINKIKLLFNRFKILTFTLFICLGLSISNSALPISINFYSNYAASNYNYKNYFSSRPALYDVILFLNVDDDLVILNKSFHKDFYKFSKLKRFTNLDDYLGKYFLFNTSDHISDGSTYSEKDFQDKIKNSLLFLHNNCELKYNNDGFLLFKC